MDVDENVKAEVSAIHSAIRSHPELRGLGITLISRCKAEMEGRGKIKEDELDRLRRAFNAAVAVFDE